MGFYNDVVLPRLCDLAFATSDSRPIAIGWWALRKD
jgi:hypothetical protein